MPDHVREALIDRGVLDLDRNRPAFRRNDDLGWIDGASRIDQMLDELERGGVYMKMDHPPSRKA